MMAIGDHFDWWNYIAPKLCRGYGVPLKEVESVPTGVQLWNDKKFIEKRIIEQNIAASIAEWDEEAGYITPERYKEVMPGILHQQRIFVERLKELNGDVAQSGERLADIQEGEGS